MTDEPVTDEPVTDKEDQTPRPTVLRYEDSWDELEAQLHADREAGLAHSAVRAGVEAWLDERSFVEIGTVVRRNSSSYRGGDTGEEQPNEVPVDGLIAGWGHREGRLVFVTADDPDLGSPLRGVAAASKATRIRGHALAQSGPLVQIFAADRIDPDAFIGAEFVRFGYGVDLDFEREAADRILKIGVVTDSLGDQAAREAVWCHMVVLAGSDAAINGFAGIEALQRGLADVTVDSLPEALELVDAMLAHLPASCFDEPSRPPTADVSDDSFVDAGWSLELAPQWQPNARTSFVTIDGRVVGLIELDEGVFTTAAVSRKLLRLVRFCDAFRLPVLICHAGLERPVLPDVGDVDAVDQLRQALHGATTPVLEIGRAGCTLRGDLGLRPTWSVDVQGNASGDAAVAPAGLRQALIQALAALPCHRMRPDEDPRTNAMAPRPLRSAQ